MNELKIFKNDAFGEVRVTEVNGEPMFCLADVCRVLGLTAKVVNQRLQDDVVSKYPIVDNLGREQQALFVNEDGLYDVILDSRKPEAKVFRKWVTSEVLPSIRKIGGYMVSRVDDTDEDIMARAILIANDTIKRREERIAVLQNENSKQAEKIAEDAPKVNFANALTASTDTILVRELAKLMNQNGIKIGGNRLWDWLRDNGYVCKGKCEPTQIAMEQKLFVVVTRSIENGSSQPIVKRTTKVTQKGCQYFINKFIEKRNTQQRDMFDGNGNG